MQCRRSSCKHSETFHFCKAAIFSSTSVTQLMLCSSQIISKLLKVNLKSSQITLWKEKSKAWHGKAGKEAEAKLSRKSHSHSDGKAFRRVQWTRRRESLSEVFSTRQSTLIRWIGERRRGTIISFYEMRYTLQLFSPITIFPFRQHSSHARMPLNLFCVHCKVCCFYFAKNGRRRERKNEWT